MPVVTSGVDEPDDDGDLAECPECGAEVYLIAGRCPACGYWFLDGDRASMRGRGRIRGELRLLKWAAILLVVMFVLAVAVALLAN
jgi:hypothetical protein